MTIFGGSRSVAVKLGLDAKGYLTGLASAGKATQDFARAADQSLGKHRRNFDEIGSAATRAGLVIGAGTAAAVISFAKFDQSMSRAAAGTQATAAQMDLLRKAAIAAGRDTKFSATEASDAITAMGKAGVGVSDILGGGLTGALSLAAAGELGVADAAEIAATAMTQFGLKGSDLPHVADLLAAGAGKAQGSVADLAAALKYVGPVAKNANVPIEETVGVLAELASQGIIGEQAGTSLRGVLLALESPTKASAKAMKGLGLNLYDSAGKFIGLEAAAGQLHDQLGGLTEAERNAALGTIFGNEQITAATILYKGGAGAIRDWTTKVNDSGYAARQAGQLMDNLAGDFEQLKGSLETALISSGSGANSGLRSLTQGATTAVNAFMALPAGVQESTVVIGGLTAASLLLVGGMIKGAIAVKTMRTNLGELGITAEGTKGKLASVGKAGAALAVFELAAAGVGSLQTDLAETTIKAGETQRALGQLASGVPTEKLGTFGKSFGDLGGQLDQLANPGLQRRSEDLLSSITGLVTFGSIGNSQGSEGRRQLLADLGQLDTQLAGLVASGKTHEARKLFDQLNAKAIAGGAGTDQLAIHLSSYRDALKGAAAASKDTSAGATDMGESMSTAAADASKLAGSLKDVRDAARDANGAFLDSRSAARDFQQSLDDATERLAGRGAAAKKVAEAQADLRKAKTTEQKKRATEALAAARKEAADYAAGLDNTTEAGRRNQESLDRIAAAAQGQADALLKAGGTDAEYRASLDEWGGQLLRVATSYGLTGQKLQDFLDLALRPPEAVVVPVSVTGVDKAIADLDLLIGKQATINGKTVTINAEVNSGNVREDRGGAVVQRRTPVKVPSRLRPRAAGGPVTAGQGYWVGERGPEPFFPNISGQILPSHLAMPAAGQPASGGVHVVRVPVRETSTTTNPVNINGPVTVVAPSPSKFTDWSRTEARFGTGGQR